MKLAKNLFVSTAVALAIAFAALPANAAVVINITESAGNVDVVASGSLDITGADPYYSGPTYDVGIISGGANWYVAPGSGGSYQLYNLTGVTVPFGTSTTFYHPPTSSSGDTFFIWGYNGLSEGPQVGVAGDYTSGDAIFSQMQFVGQSIAGLTLTPGTYLFTVPNDTITLNIAAAGAVPEPGTLALLGLGLVGLAAARRRR